jgi:predicted RNase H-like nuclease (RuvC/YqgF family)
MATEESSGRLDPPAPLEKSEQDLLSWRRFGEFIRNVLRLERSVEALKKENGELDQRIKALQRQFDEQTGQLKVLADFVNKALDERVESQAEEAAIRAFERMASLVGLDAAKRPRQKDR